MRERNGQGSELGEVAEMVSWGASPGREGSFKEDLGLNHSDSHFIDSKVTACGLRVTSVSLKVESKARQAVRGVGLH